MLCVLVDLASPKRRPPSRNGSCSTSSPSTAPDLLDRPRLVVGTKADAVQLERAEAMGWDGPWSPPSRPGLSASWSVGWRRSCTRHATGARARGARGDPARADGSHRRARRTRGSSGLVGREVERIVALNDVTTPDALGYIDHRLEQLGVHRMLARAGAQEGDVVWIGEFSFEYQPDL